MRQSLGSNSQIVTRGSYQIPTCLAVCGRNLFSPRLLNHGMGNWYEPLVTRGGITFPFTCGKLLVKGKVPCLGLILNGLGHILTEELYWTDLLTNQYFLLHFVAFSGVASLVVIGIDNRKVGVDNRKTVGRQQKSSRADKWNNFLMIWPHFSIQPAYQF
jgi:hypothetical protein